jgi:hypothetical protein
MRVVDVTLTPYVPLPWMLTDAFPLEPGGGEVGGGKVVICIVVPITQKVAKTPITDALISMRRHDVR